VITWRIVARPFATAIVVAGAGAQILYARVKRRRLKLMTYALERAFVHDPWPSGAGITQWSSQGPPASGAHTRASDCPWGHVVDVATLDWMLSEQRPA
jgi:hypothetical protein